MATKSDHMLPDDKAILMEARNWNPENSEDAYFEFGAKWMRREALKAIKKQATKFTEWLEADYCLVTDYQGRSAWVNKTENTIYINGSSAHYANLVMNYGKTIEELYDIFSPPLIEETNEEEN